MSAKIIVLADERAKRQRDPMEAWVRLCSLYMVLANEVALKFWRL